MDSAVAPEPLDPDRLLRINRLATVAGLVAGLAHELNNSLQVVGGMVELLGDRQDLPADVVVRLQRIGGQTDKAVAAIHRVLGFSRDGAPESRKVNLSVVVDQVLSLRSYRLGRNGIMVTVDKGSELFEVRAVERQLVQAVLNLVLNAEEALAGQPQREVRVALTRAGAMAQLQVQDSGPGVAAEFAERIFEPYFTTKSAAGAVGLGLPATRAIASRLGGRLFLGASGPGPSFVLELPLFSPIPRLAEVVGG